MAKEAPLAQMKRLFESKEKLVAKLSKELPDPNGDLQARLAIASNSKLLRLESRARLAKELGGAEKIVESVASLSGRSKDKDYQTKLAGYSIGRLLDMKTSLERKVSNKNG